MNEQSPIAVDRKVCRWYAEVILNVIDDTVISARLIAFVFHIFARCRCSRRVVQDQSNRLPIWSVPGTGVVLVPVLEVLDAALQMGIKGLSQLCAEGHAIPVPNLRRTSQSPRESQSLLRVCSCTHG